MTQRWQLQKHLIWKYRQSCRYRRFCSWYESQWRCHGKFAVEFSFYRHSTFIFYRNVNNIEKSTTFYYIASFLNIIRSERLEYAVAITRHQQHCILSVIIVTAQTKKKHSGQRKKLMKFPQVSCTSRSRSSMFSAVGARRAHMNYIIRNFLTGHLRQSRRHDRNHSLIRKTEYSTEHNLRKFEKNKNKNANWWPF